jgi:general secretion pathway protein D
LNDAFNILSTALDLRGFELRKQDKNMVVAPKNGGRNGGGNRPPIDWTSIMGSQTNLKVYPIQFASATAVARVINDVYASGTTSANPLAQLFNRFGGGGGGGQGRGQIQINANPGGGAGGFQMPQTPQVHASADDFSNSVIVNASSKQQTEIEGIIKQVDKQSTNPFQSHVYKLVYASSDDLASAVQNVLTANAPQGRGGQTSSSTDIGARFQQAARLGSAQASFGTVVSEPRSNSLIVTATPENQSLVGDVIAKLDQPIAFADSAVVIPLSNANALQVAYTINQAFKSPVANTSFAGYGNATRVTGGTGTSNSGNLGSTNGGLRGLGGAAPDNQASIIDQQAKQVELAMADPNSTSGDLKTNVDVSAELALQGFGGGGGIFGGQNRGGQNSQNTANQPMQARDENGKLVNVHNLNGNVTVIPDQNTNSVIVVTNPENMTLVRTILDQLDRIPQQVMIETIICEATLDASDKLGVEWSFVQGKAFGNKGTTGNLSQNFGVQAANPLGFKYTLAGGNLSAFIDALATDTKFTILSTPRIFTTNNVQASINVSQQIPYITSSVVDATGSVSNQYQFTDVGVILTVTPRITANGYVSMDVNQTASDLQNFTSFNAPIINQRVANTTVSVKDGETIILGGIIRNTVSTTVNKIPILGDIPILGNLFKSTSKDNAKDELLVFLTPHIVLNAEDAKKLRDQGMQDLSKGNRDGVQKIIDQQQQLKPIKNSNNTPPPKEGGH